MLITSHHASQQGVKGLLSFSEAFTIHLWDTPAVLTIHIFPFQWLCAQCHQPWHVREFLHLLNLSFRTEFFNSGFVLLAKNNVQEQWCQRLESLFLDISSLYSGFKVSSDDSVDCQQYKYHCNHLLLPLYLSFKVFLLEVMLILTNHGSHFQPSLHYILLEFLKTLIKISRFCSLENHLERSPTHHRGEDLNVSKVLHILFWVMTELS